MPLIQKLREEFDESVILLENKITRHDILEFKPDYIISYNYKFIIKKDVLDLLPNKFINLHISYLPWNRGAYPNVWSFLDETPKGVSVHIIDEGIDTGDVLVQEKVPLDEERETLASSYVNLHVAIRKLFLKNWEKIKKSEINSVPQAKGGSIHYIKDFERINHLLEPENWDISVPELKSRYNNFLKSE